jgi:DNA gyrase inhibitor GyrI
VEITIQQLAEVEVAYIRRTGSYFEPQEHWGDLISWAIQNGLFPPEQSFIGISLDNPAKVEDIKCRHDACVTIPENFSKESRGDIQYKKLPGGQYARLSFYDVPEMLNKAYNFMFEEWLPTSQFEADWDRHNLEYNLNNPAEDPEGKCRVDLYIPIK